MAKHCEICGKAPVMGNQVTIRGKAKYLGGVGTKVTGISRRQFKPNLQRVRVTTAKGTNTTMRVCTQCIRTRRGDQARPQRPVQAARPAPARPKRPQLPMRGSPGSTSLHAATSECAHADRSHEPHSRKRSKRSRCWPGCNSRADELDRMTAQMGQIVGYVESLAELNTDDVEPMAHALDVANVFAADELRAEPDRATRRWPTRRITIGEFYLVPAVLGE